MHARGGGAYGVLEATKDARKYTKASLVAATTFHLQQRTCSRWPCPIPPVPVLTIVFDMCDSSNNRPLSSPSAEIWSWRTRPD